MKMRKRVVLGAAALAAVLTLCWSVYAAGNDKRSEGGVKLAIHEYISGNANTKDCMQRSMQLLEEMYSGKRSYSEAAINSQLETLMSCRSSISTDNEQLLELENLYLQEFTVVKSALCYAQFNSERTISQGDRDCIRRLAEQAYNLEKKENSAYISLFQKAGMEYSTNQDGRISYEYSN